MKKNKGVNIMRSKWDNLIIVACFLALISMFVFYGDKADAAPPEMLQKLDAQSITLERGYSQYSDCKIYLVKYGRYKYLVNSRGGIVRLK